MQRGKEMSKKEKEKKSKSAILEYGGKYYKIKPTKNPYKDLPKYSNAAVVLASYTNMYERIYSNHPTTAFVREYREHRLIPALYKHRWIPLSDAIRNCINDIDIGAMDSKLIKETESGYNVLTTHIIQNPKKPGGYYKLAPDSDPLNGFSKQVSNYIIDNASAIHRIISAPVLSDEIIERFRKTHNTTLYYSGLCMASVDYLFKKNIDIETFNKLDLRKCMLGDIQYILDEPRVPVFCYNDSGNSSISYLDVSTDLRVCWFDEMTVNGLSSAFGSKIWVVTNPEVILDYLIRYTENSDK